jgi:peroxiredoxin
MGGNNVEARQLAWFSATQFEVANKTAAVTKTDRDVAAVLTALGAALAEGETLSRVIQLQKSKAIASGGHEIQGLLGNWREKINELAAKPAAFRFLKDREKGFVDFISVMSPSLAETELRRLVDSDDYVTANWAKTELVYLKMRNDPFDLKFTALEAKGKGREIDFQKLNGRVVYLYFWMVDSKNVVQDIGKINGLYAETSRRKFEVIGICLDSETKRQDVLGFIQRNKIKWPQYFDGQGKNGDLCKKMSVQETPVGFVFEPNGKLGAANVRAGALKSEVGKRL